VTKARCESANWRAVFQQILLAGDSPASRRPGLVTIAPPTIVKQGLGVANLGGGSDHATVDQTRSGLFARFQRVVARAALHKVRSSSAAGDHLLHKVDGRRP